MDDGFDEKCVELIRQGDREAMEKLLEKYKYQVRIKARSLFLMGGDTDDLIQEGMIGLYKAIRDFNPAKETSFATFAEICIVRQMYTAVNASMRKKNIPLNTYVPIADMEKEGESQTLSRCSDSEGNPEQIIIGRETVAEMKKKLEESLSSLEKGVFQLYLEGADYMEIAKQLNRSPKSVDNALHRIRSKAKNLTDGDRTDRR